jgi:cellulose synthase/poly-beta-1,6-N-acetylglucosamine synthase-like glycosyltransferase
MKSLAFVVYGIYILTILWILINGFIQLHLFWHAQKQNSIRRRTLHPQLPFVSIQVPVYNEKYVIKGLLQSLTHLDYPKHLYEIQVLDDSTDETSSIIDHYIIDLKNKCSDVQVIRRENRKGFKAGALQYGLTRCKGELIAIFDADFRPPATFLKDMIPHFGHAEVGLVQARWGHLNKEQNFLTRIQTLLLDMHFTVEQAGRHNAGYFINFCGTAGIWRKKCIMEAGGWDGDILSEDLDLSYRAQLKGWTVVYDQDIQVPAELPAVIDAFKIQQFRWTKGIAQVAKKTLGRVWESPIPFNKKLHSTFHLLSSSLFPCLLVNALLTLPVLVLRNLYPDFKVLTDYTAFGGLNLLVLTFLYYKSATKDNNTGAVFFMHYPIFLVVYLAMSVQNTIAVLQGLWGIRSAFIRTPKFSGTPYTVTSYQNKKVSWITFIELAVLCYFLYAIGLSVFLGDYFLIAFFMMMAWGLSILVFKSLETKMMGSFFT